LYALILLVILCVQYLPVSIATSKFQPKNSISESNLLSLNRLKKCESSWWSNRKNIQKWSNRKNWCTSDSEYHSSRKSNKEIWSNWEKFSQCRCESLNWDIKNPAGIFVCYQIAWFNKFTGKFVGELSVYKLSSKNKCKDESSHVAFKFSEFNVNIHKMSRLKHDSSGFYHGISPRFSWKKDDMTIHKFYVHGKISKSELINKKILIDILSPSEYKVIIGLKEYELKKNLDVANLLFSNYLPDKPFSHLVDDCSSYNNRPSDDPTNPNGKNNSDDPTNPNGKNNSDENTPTRTTNPVETQTQVPTSGSNSNPDIVAPNVTTMPNPLSSPMPSSNVAAPADASPTGDVTNINSPNSSPNSPPSSSPNALPDSSPDSTDSSTDSSPDALPDSSSSSSPTSSPVNAADQESSSSTPTPLPGATLGVLPIGLGIFGAIILIAVIFVLYSRYQSGKWTKQYRRRQAIRSENLVNAPGFNVGNNAT
ncbi:25368_t:CDS:1, partial [Dentiscutata erythropus]